MFLGHWGLSFAAKRVKPEVSLGTWFLATQFPGMLWPCFVLLGWEKFHILHDAGIKMPFDFYYYPWTHSLAGNLLFGIAFGGVHYAFFRRFGPALLLGLAVLSHWFLDFLMHRPDLPLWFGDSPKFGAGLIDVLPAYMSLEFGGFLVGFWLYLRLTRGRERRETLVLWAMVVILCLGQLYRIFGPVPKREIGIAISAQIQWLWVGIAYWVDRRFVT